MSSDDIHLRPPKLRDAAPVYRLIQEVGSMDVNSCYSYLLQALHFHQTCAVAVMNQEVVGYLSAYTPPVNPNVLFVWQVVVHGDARRRGLGARLIDSVLEREGNRPLEYVEATVAPSNTASMRLFHSLARSHKTQFQKEALFGRDLFAGPHEDEFRIRVGPLAL